MFKPYSLNCVCKFDINRKIVAVELEFVARTQAGVLIKIGAQGGHSAVKLQAPVFVLVRVGLVVHAGGGAHRGLLNSVEKSAFGCAVVCL